MVAVEGEETVQETNAQGEKIFVSVRLRPLNQKEITRDDVSDWECINGTTIIYRNNLSVSERSMYPSAYTFDRVFSSDCSTRQVYELGAKEVALSVVSGINASIFAYGQTSSGKTYTMSGITEYTIADIYDYVEKHNEREFLMKFSAMEIYNESVRDLLSTDSTPLRLLDDPERGTTVEKLTEETLRDWNHFQELISICEAQRQIGETALNETSSRSHQILRLTIESSTREFVGNDSSSILTATVNFVDLAGSERASQSLSAGARLKEGCHINRSLLTLGTVIRKLSKGRSGHIPFRDSKLTRILQSSLGGNARTSIICTMSPARSHVEQSRNTLLFASCAKEVSTNAQVNIVMSDKALVKHLQRELARLESELRSPGSNTATSDYDALLREKDFQIDELKKEIYELTLQKDLVQSELEDLRVSRGSERVSIADAHNNYPQLRVRSAWEFDDPISTSSTAADPRSLENSVRTFDAAHYSDGHSHSDSDDQFIPIPYYEENSVQSRRFSQLSISIPDISRNTDGQEAFGEHYDENSEDFCKEVRCIEMEDQSLSWHVNADTSPSRESEAVSNLIIAENAEQVEQKPGSPNMKESQLLDTAPKVLEFPSPEKSFSVLQKVELSKSGSFNLVRSRSCKESLMSNLYTLSLENMKKNHVFLQDGQEDDSGDRPDGWQRKYCTYKYNEPKPLLSRNASQNFSGSAADTVQGVENTEISGDDKTYNSCITVSNSNIEATSQRLSSAEQAVDAVDHEPEAESEANITAPKKDVRDVGLDPMQDERENSLQWPSEFRRIQKEIIELWNICNALLVHRTYFFLLFKGDPADSIYMEVELRRLTFLKDTFARGNKTLDNGRVLSAASSLRDLRRERQMLSKQIQKKLNRQEKERLFQRWGINLNSKNRSLQLAHQLWINTEDMEHITESASVVARLVGLVHPAEASKEMFGLHFTPRPSYNKSSIWKNSVMSIL